MKDILKKQRKGTKADRNERQNPFDKDVQSDKSNKRQSLTEHGLCDTSIYGTRKEEKKLAWKNLIEAYKRRKFDNLSSKGIEKLFAASV